MKARVPKRSSGLKRKKRNIGANIKRLKKYHDLVI